MSRILKIDDFEESFPTKYGLDADGSCYEIKSPFDIMIIVDYEDLDGQTDTKYKSPKWEKFKTSKGDVILCSKNGSFIFPKDREGFVECTPVKDSNQQDISFDTFPKNSLKKIGKDLFRMHSMPIEERKKMTIFNGL